MREIVHLQAGQCGNQIGAKVSLKEKHYTLIGLLYYFFHLEKQVVALLSNRGGRQRQLSLA